MIEIKGFDQSFLYRKTLLPKQLILITLISLCAANGIGIALYGIRPVVLICSVFFLIIMCIVKRRTDGELQCETVKATTKIEFLPDMIRIVNLFDQNIPVQNFICFICTSDATEKTQTYDIPYKDILEIFQITDLHSTVIVFRSGKHKCPVSIFGNCVRLTDFLTTKIHKPVPASIDEVCSPEEKIIP